MDSTPKIIRKIGLVVLKDKKIMMVRSDDESEVFYILGGKIEPGESDIDCIIREVREEVSCDVDLKSIEYLTEFEDMAHGKENTVLQMKIYKGELLGEPKESSEVAEITYFDSLVNPRHLSAIAKNKMFPWLKEKGLIA